MSGVTPKLELRALRKEYGGGEVVAVDDVSLSVAPGETLALLGPSGCGKSTTLNMIVGLETPTSGDILIDGVSVVATPAGQRNVGLVFQDYAVFTHMTVRGNLAFGLEARGVARDEIRQRVGETAEMLDLTRLIDVRADRLAGSELQRVAIGRTLVTRPALLLLDEPLSNLEAEMRAAMRRELRRLQGEIGLTIVYVTHDQIEALSLASRIAVMSDGKLRQCAPTTEVWEQPAHTFVAGFLGEPPMNLIEGTLAPDGLGAAFITGALRVPLMDAKAPLGADVVLGVRPEAIRLTAPNGGLTATVRSVEPRGPETVVGLDINGVRVAAIAPSQARPAEGETLGVVLDAGRLALFRADTRRNLSEITP